MNKPEAVIIGSGVGGLATAIRLRAQGFPVTVFEKNSYPGGKITVIEKEGFRFDAGPSLFTQPENIEELFKVSDRNIADYFECQPVDLACRYFFENGKTINAFTDRFRFARELQDVAGEEFTAVLNYLEDSARAYDQIGGIFLNHSLHKVNTWLQRPVLNALKSLKTGYLFRNLDEYNRSRLRTPEATQIFNRFATYNGSDPYQAPGMLSMIPHLEHNLGVFYPKGGMISITKALFQLATDLGVQFHFNAAVDSILYEKQKVKGISVNGESHFSSIVVSNADVYFTWLKLIKNKAIAEKILRNERSSSALIFYWGIGRRSTELDLHNILFSGSYRDEFEHLFRKKQMYQDPTVYINITSKLEKDHAPDGMENWFVMVNAPSLDKQNWENETEIMREHVIRKIIRLTDIPVESLICFEEVLTPAMIESRTGSFMGSLYGTSSNSKWSAFLRHPNFIPQMKGLYFAGGSAHPGGGIPLCLKSAKITSELIAKTYT